MKLLIENGADVNLMNDFGDTALLWTNNFDTVKLLFDAGANINVANSVGDTALLKAASRGNVIGRRTDFRDDLVFLCLCF